MKKLAENVAESIPIAIPMSYIKTMLPSVKKHLFLRKDIALTRVCVVKYLFPAPVEVY